MRGHLDECFFDYSGNRIAVVVKITCGNVLNIPVGLWHFLRFLESGMALLECKEGDDASLSEDEIWSLF